MATDLLWHAIRYMDDMHRDLGRDGVDTPAFLDGYNYAFYHAKEHYINYSGKYACECAAGPLAHLNTDGEWFCGDCEAFLTTEEDLLRDDDDVERSTAGMDNATR